MMSSRERAICDLLEPSVSGLGYELVGVELGGAGSGSVLRVFIDCDAGITVGDCEKASRQIGAVLDVTDPIPESYHLEVSSPGLDRPLLTEDHFARFAGHPVQLRTTEPMDGRRGWKGRLVGCREGNVVVREGDEERLIPLDLIGKANLVPEV
jgi:ribosome maturation factor RimP